MKKKQTTTKMHFLDHSIQSNTNPVTINLIGAGGTGSYMADALARADYALVQLGYAGIQVNVFDPDEIDTPNFARSKFNQNYNGINKAVSIVSHLNRSNGTNWKAVPERFDDFQLTTIPSNRAANITISCVDTVKARVEIAERLQLISAQFRNVRNTPLYWMDFGNTQFTGQAIFSTIKVIEQPDTTDYQGVPTLPLVTEEFFELFKTAKIEDHKPSCSLFDALNQQSLYINSTLANLGGALLYNLITTGMTQYRGYFLDLLNFRCQPIPV